MLKILQKIHRSLISKLLILVGLSLFLSVSVWAYFNIKYQKKKLMDGIVSSADTLTTAVKLGAHYAMMNNLRDDINRIIKKVATAKNLENIRIYNKEGQIKYSNFHAEVDPEDEMGQLSLAISKMAKQIGEKQQELNKRRDEYQTLFERVPCIITVQDRNYRLIRYNREFNKKLQSPTRRLLLRRLQGTEPEMCDLPG